MVLGDLPARKRARRTPGSEIHALALDIDVHASRPQGWQVLAPASVERMPTLHPTARARFIWAADSDSLQLLPAPAAQTPSSSSARGHKRMGRQSRSVSAAAAESSGDESAVEVLAVKSLAIRTQCHSCRRNLAHVMMRCRSIHDGVVCPEYYCRRCVQSDYRGSIKWDPDSRSFQCPKCLGFCKCYECTTTRASSGAHLLNGRSYESSRMYADASRASTSAAAADPEEWDFNSASSPVKDGPSKTGSALRRKNFGWSRTGSRNNAIVIPDDDDNDAEWSLAPVSRKPVSVPRRRKANPHPPPSLPPTPSSSSQHLHSSSSSAPVEWRRTSSPSKLERTPTTFWRSGSEVDPALVAAANRASHQEALRKKTSLKIRIKRPKTGAFSASAASTSAAGTKAALCQFMRKSVSPLGSELSNTSSSSHTITGGEPAAASPSVSSSTLIEAERNVWVKGRADMSTDEDDDEHFRHVIAQRRRLEENERERRWLDSTGGAEAVPTSSQQHQHHLKTRPPTFSDDDGLSDAERRWRRLSRSIERGERADERRSKTSVGHWKYALQRQFDDAAASSGYWGVPAFVGHGLTERSCHKVEPGLFDTDGALLANAGPASGLGAWFVDRREEGLQLGIGMSMGLSCSGVSASGGVGGVGAIGTSGEDTLVVRDSSVGPPAVTEAEQLKIAAVKVEEAAAAAAAASSEGGEEMISPLIPLLPGVSPTEFVPQTTPVFEGVTSIEGGMAVIEGGGHGRSSSATASSSKRTLDEKHSPRLPVEGGQPGAGTANGTSPLFDPHHPELSKMSVDGTPLPPHVPGGSINGPIRPGATDANLSLSFPAGANGVDAFDDDDAADMALFKDRMKANGLTAAAAGSDATSLMSEQREADQVPSRSSRAASPQDDVIIIIDSDEEDGADRGSGPSRARTSISRTGRKRDRAQLEEDDLPDPILREFEAFANFDAFVMPATSLRAVTHLMDHAGEMADGNGSINGENRDIVTGLPIKPASKAATPLPAQALALSDLQGYFSDVSVGKGKRGKPSKAVDQRPGPTAAPAPVAAPAAAPTQQPINPTGRRERKQATAPVPKLLGASIQAQSSSVPKVPIRRAPTKKAPAAPIAPVQPQSRTPTLVGGGATSQQGQASALPLMPQARGPMAVGGGGASSHALPAPPLPPTSSTSGFAPAAHVPRDVDAERLILSPTLSSSSLTSLGSDDVVEL
ncbi:hypothetical protein V8E36_009646 [Tilletia maclaganii]